MALNSGSRATEAVEAIVRRARSLGRKGRTKSQDDFLRQYFAHVPPRDMREDDAANLAGAAMDHLEFAATRKPKRSKVRVFNPRTEVDGWHSDHTVVEVVTDDMPFLVDTVSAALNREELVVFLVIHPIVGVRRDRAGRLKDAAAAAAPEGRNESFMLFEVSRISGARLGAVRAAVESVLADVRVAVDDWLAMRNALGDIIGEFDTPTATPTIEDTLEAQAFLKWLHDDNFMFLGFRDYDFIAKGKDAAFGVRRRKGMGILRDPKRWVARQSRALDSTSPGVRAFLRNPDILMVSKSDLISTVHRPAHMDMIGIKRFDARGKVIGRRQFVGLFTSAAYNLSPRDIPLLRLKIRKAIERAGFGPASHDGKALQNILETFPRDELFQVSDDHLFNTGMGILYLQDRHRVALFIRRDEFERFVSCLIYVPRDRYTTELRLRIQDILGRAFAGQTSAHYIHFSDAPLARLHVIVQTTPGKIPPYDPSAIEREVAEATRSWADDLGEVLIAAHGEEKADPLWRQYADAFPSAYRESFDARSAMSDIPKIEEALATDAPAMEFYRPENQSADRVALKVFSPNRQVPLSDVLPMLEHMGLRVIDEVPYAIRPRPDDTDLVMIHDFGMATRDRSAVDVRSVGPNFKDAFGRVWHGEMESDGFNALVLFAGLNWREVTVLRAYCKFLRQIGIPFSQAYMEQTLANNPTLARLIVTYFQALFNPRQSGDSARRAGRVRRELGVALDAVSSADEDRILRRFVNAVESTLRTNAFQRDDGAPKDRLSLKFDSRALDELPLPRPMHEIFVYNPRVEGVHLRFGLVARGGLRWSDRPEDFRTEVLGLAKAQQVKNAVIVPVGSKGGFVVKRPPADGDREAFQNEGIACYKTFVRGLFDVTDNLVGDGVVPPPDVSRRDGDDPYLVVAADKGTATFSDIANGLSESYGFWLGDAFASGGSVGYDHKKMGITSRGAWESVKRHFRETGLDIQKQEFTAVGVGDMSGDVFGNGMLRSRHTKLLGAFNHLHIFVDPDPDPEKSFAERRRLFGLARSSWSDYDAKVLSKGGAVFERSAKTVTVSPEVRRRFALSKDTLAPNELMQAIVKSEVDLLWFGGIGTYVKASDESHAEAGDRANDALRVDAKQLRCRVLGEGANLAMTQRARIEYALGGGRLNSDSIDNSAGVDCSDHEVNIKILLDSAVTSGRLSKKQRDALLAEMTAEVASLVLRNNYLQTQAISMVRARGIEVFDDQIRMLRMLERAGRLNRNVEVLPDDEQLAERAAMKQPLTRPEIAVLMPHAKIWVYDELLGSELPDDPRLSGDLIGYFPTPLQKRFKSEILRHRLRREIIAMLATNSMINRVGGSFVTQMIERSGLPPADVARAYIVTRDVFEVREIWNAVEKLDNKVSADVQTDILLAVNRLIERGTLWFLRHSIHPIDMAATYDTFAPGIQTIATALSQIFPGHYLLDLQARAQALVEGGVPRILAMRVVGLLNMISGLDIVRLAQRHHGKVVDIARLYFAIGARFQLGRLRAAAERIEPENHWQQLAAAALIEDMFASQGALTSRILGVAKPGGDAVRAIDLWFKDRTEAVESTEVLLSEILEVEAVDFSMLAVASRRLQALTEAPEQA
ncbi:MAG: NAD-glutamate dehydrogenase [Rhodospirillales bacterium]|nr:NAD-glutamate dehydrogenase [Rhodospirillales bacterium]